MEKIKTQVFKLVDLIKYHEGSIVSRTLIDREAGTLTLFAFDEGQGLSGHTAPYDAMAYVLEGEAEILIAGEAFHLREGETLIMPANRPHAVKALRRFKMLLVMIES